MSWTDAVDGFARWLAVSTRSAATVDGYVKHATWLAETAPTGPWDLTAAQLADWLAVRGWSQTTQRKVLVSLRSFYAWALSEGLTDWSPTAGVSTGQARQRGPERRPMPPRWAAPLAEYLAWLRAGGRSTGTQEQRRWWLGRLAEVAADPWAVTGQQLAQWLSSPDWSPDTRRAGRSSVRSFYAWAVGAGYLATSPAADLPTVRVPRALPRPAPTDAIRTALSRADDRIRLAVMLASHAGLRRAEIATLHTRQIGATELLVIGKGGHERRVPLHPVLSRELLAELARRRNGGHGSGFRGRHVSATGYLFPSDRGGGPVTPAHLGGLIAAALPEEWTTHTLRHWFATSAYQGQRDLRAVQELLGHAKPETTARYAAVPEGALTRAVHGLAL